MSAAKKAEMKEKDIQAHIVKLFKNASKKCEDAITYLNKLGEPFKEILEASNLREFRHKEDVYRSIQTIISTFLGEMRNSIMILEKKEYYDRLDTKERMNLNTLIKDFEKVGKTRGEIFREQKAKIAERETLLKSLA